MANGLTLTLDVAQWLKPGERNTARVLVTGPKGATAILTVGDVPTGGAAAAGARTQGSRKLDLEFTR